MILFFIAARKLKSKRTLQFRIKNKMYTFFCLYFFNSSQFNTSFYFFNCFLPQRTPPPPVKLKRPSLLLPVYPPPQFTSLPAYLPTPPPPPRCTLYLSPQFIPPSSHPLSLHLPQLIPPSLSPPPSYLPPPFIPPPPKFFPQLIPPAPAPATPRFTPPLVVGGREGGKKTLGGVGMTLRYGT